MFIQFTPTLSLALKFKRFPKFIKETLCDILSNQINLCDCHGSDVSLKTTIDQIDLCHMLHMTIWPLVITDQIRADKLSRNENIEKLVLIEFDSRICVIQYMFGLNTLYFIFNQQRTFYTLNAFNRKCLHFF